MSLKKWIIVLHAIITGSIFLPWYKIITFGYANIPEDNTPLRFGFELPVAWLLVVFCIGYYLLDFIFKKTDPLIISKFKDYINWSLVIIVGFAGLSNVFGSGKEMRVVYIGMTVAFVASLAILVISKIKLDYKD
ncbi:MAG: hypothetical protein WCQ41_00750 [Bacillota bacterium]